jgi:urease gamma subunit
VGTVAVLLGMAAEVAARERAGGICVGNMEEAAANGVTVEVKEKARKAAVERTEVSKSGSEFNFGQNV